MCIPKVDEVLEAIRAEVGDEAPPELLERCATAAHDLVIQRRRDYLREAKRASRARARAKAATEAA